MRKARQIVDRTLEAAMAVLMTAMVGAVLWQVFTRFILRNPSSGTEEFVRFALLWLSLLGASYGFGQRSHLAIDLLGRSSRTGIKTVQRLAVLGVTGSFAVIVLIYGGARLMQFTLRLGQSSAALSVERGFLYVVVPLSGALVLFYSLAEATARLRSLRKG